MAGRMEARNSRRQYVRTCVPNNGVAVVFLPLIGMFSAYVCLRYTQWVVLTKESISKSIVGSKQRGALASSPSSYKAKYCTAPGCLWLWHTQSARGQRRKTSQSYGFVLTRYLDVSILLEHTTFLPVLTKLILFRLQPLFYSYSFNLSRTY